MDAISYLKQEHALVRKLFAEISEISDMKKKKTKFDALCKFLINHETKEQKAWYPALRKNKELSEVIKHLVSEEKSAAKTIKTFKTVRFDFIWKLKFYKFRRDVDHHAKEEEKELFPKVRKVLTKAELNLLGVKLRKFK